MDPSSDLDIQSVVTILRRRAPLVIGVIVLCTLAAFIVSKLQTPRYTATATILFQSDTAAAAASGLVQPQTTNPQGEQQTNLDLVTLGSVAQLTAQELHSGTSGRQVLDMVTTSPLGQSNLVAVSATATQPAYAATVANTFVRQFIASREASDQATVASAIRLVEGQYTQLTPGERKTVEGQDLLARVETLRIYRAMQDSTTLAKQATVPTSPSSPAVLRNSVVGAFLGVLIAVALAFLLHRFDQRLRDLSDIENAYHMPLLAVIPHSATEASSDSLANLEPFRMLRATLRYFNISHTLKSVLVVSAIPAEGKTTIARHLARAAAASGARTLLLEADLRRPTLAGCFGLQPRPGLADALMEPEGDLTNYIQQAQIPSHGSVDDEARWLDVLVAGGCVPNPAELLESSAMATLVDSAARRYDLVVIDTPPLTVVSDAIPLTQAVDGIVTVARAGVSRRDAATRLQAQLSKLDVHLLGVAANDVTGFGDGKYAYNYDSAVADDPSRRNGGPPAEREHTVTSV